IISVRVPSGSRSPTLIAIAVSFVVTRFGRGVVVSAAASIRRGRNERQPSAACHGAQRRRHLGGELLQVTGVQRRDPAPEPGQAGLYVLGEPGRNPAGRSEGRRLIDVE